MRIFRLLFVFVLILFFSMNIKSQTFEFKETGTGYILNSVSVPAGQNSIAYAGGPLTNVETAPGTVIKTTDGGEIWETVYQGENIQTVAFVNTEKGFAGGFNGNMKKTTDGGATWTDLEIWPNVYEYRFLRFYDEETGILFLDTNDFDRITLITSDGGDTWTEATNPPFYGVHAVNFADKNTLYATGNNGSVYKSTDSGNNWVLKREDGHDINVGIGFIDAENGVFAGEEGDLYVTHDGGDTWTNSLTTGYHFFEAIGGKGGKMLAAGTDEQIFYSDSMGDDFTLAFDGGGQASFKDIAFFDDNTGLISASGGKMVKFNNVFMDLPKLSKAEVSIYPVPASDILNIKSNETIDWVELIGMNGQKLIQKNINSNSGQLELSNFPAGVYILRIKSGNEIKTQKISIK